MMFPLTCPLLGHFLATFAMTDVSHPKDQRGQWSAPLRAGKDLTSRWAPPVIEVPERQKMTSKKPHRLVESENKYPKKGMSNTARISRSEIQTPNWWFTVDDVCPLVYGNCRHCRFGTSNGDLSGRPCHQH